MHRQAPLQHEKKLVLDLVVVPHELAFEFDELHELSIQFRDDARAPVLIEEGKLMGKVDLLHGIRGNVTAAPRLEHSDDDCGRRFRVPAGVGSPPFCGEVPDAGRSTQ